MSRILAVDVEAFSKIARMYDKIPGTPIYDDERNSFFQVDYLVLVSFLRNPSF